MLKVAAGGMGCKKAGQNTSFVVAFVVVAAAAAVTVAVVIVVVEHSFSFFPFP